MKLYKNFTDKNLKKRPRAVAIGVFDGVHKGHQKILRAMMRRAGQKGLSPTVITFDPHPNKILFPKTPHPILMSLEHRLRVFERLGVREAVVVSFTKPFSKMKHNDFLEKNLLRKLGMRSLTVGYDFRFGRKGLGDEAFLRKQAALKHFDFSAVPALRLAGGDIISSTRIRRFIEQGLFRKAQNMLGRPVSVYGTVVAGRGRGRKIGFPTANLNPHHETLPPSGVYAAWGYLGKKKLKGIIHIGKRPTFNDREASLEVHFLNFHRNIYGREIELLFVRRLRPVKKFKTAGDLNRAIRQDAKKALKVLK